jgi:hypothetical protein
MTFNIIAVIVCTISLALPFILFSKGVQVTWKILNTILASILILMNVFVIVMRCVK